MPPKEAKSSPVEKPNLGRFSSQHRIGIVEMPNVGKSTLFDTLQKYIPAENYTFCTIIEPDDKRVYLPDERFKWIWQVNKTKSKVPSFLEIRDIAFTVLMKVKYLETISWLSSVQLIAFSMSYMLMMIPELLMLMLLQGS
ncbi:hypothetical protein POM88_036461 [Heracleum sosnowskyi]|uniref:G domain-containing protein n=1 Tax=Heracleum sosnowskyi TaxID=360622 RepID=A0AAD8MF25_9APIA|nr:hypothetical protein POM88_036461 [Heracleum sosnowskyi]